MTSRRLRRLQFTVYHGQNRTPDFYRPHADTPLAVAGLLTQRELSISVQLSNPRDYTGGEFRMHDIEEQPPRDTIRQRGTLIIFPSLVRHEVTPVKTDGQRDWSWDR